jgi:acetyl-CoA carboxylase alpha subunit
MVIGNQPNYVRFENGYVGKEHASSTAWDYRYQRDMVSYAKRLGLQITTFVDTFGARPTLSDDEAAQYKVIAECLQDQMDYPYFTAGYLTGIGGSGGHIATDFMADYAVMLSGAQEFVAEPRSAAAILYKEPKQEDIIRTTNGMKPNADFLLSRKLIDHIIHEPEGGAQNHPLEVARMIRDHIVQTELEFGKLSSEDILARRDRRMRDQHPIPIGRLNN